MDENRGSIACVHGYLRIEECPTCRTVKLRTLAVTLWEKRESGAWIGEVEALDGSRYILRAFYIADVEGWAANVVCNGTMIHMSEHASRNEAQVEAIVALRRAIALREGG